jgi:predicted 3-demethylubiquinone-9 3-methyltransferase (glyoxalase superfamily)
MQKVVTFLWFPEKAEEAAALYTSLIPNSRIDRVTTMQADSPSGPPGSVQVVDFTLDGQQFQAMNAGPLDNFNHAISLVIRCETQAEIDRLWEGLGKGGEYEPCGWLKDRYGVSWQITPAVLDDWMADKDVERSRRTTEAMLQMGKLDIAELKAAYEGKQTATAR